MLDLEGTKQSLYSMNLEQYLSFGLPSTAVSEGALFVMHVFLLTANSVAIDVIGLTHETCAAGFHGRVVPYRSS